MSEYLLKQVLSDPVLQENFRRIEALFINFPLFKGKFEFFDYSLESPSYPATIIRKHRLGFKPLDIIVTSTIGPGSVTWNYTDFSATDISVTITNSVRIRFFAGAYTESNAL